MTLLLGSQAYWSFIVLKLNDKLMSRSYSDYANGERIRKPMRVAQIKPDESAFIDPIAEENAKRANGLLL